MGDSQIYTFYLSFPLLLDAAAMTGSVCCSRCGFSLVDLITAYFSVSRNFYFCCFPLQERPTWVSKAQLGHFGLPSAVSCLFLGLAAFSVLSLSVGILNEEPARSLWPLKASLLMRCWYAPMRRLLGPCQFLVGMT